MQFKQKKYKCYFCGGLVVYIDMQDKHYPYDFYYCTKCQHPYNIPKNTYPSIDITVKLEEYPDNYAQGTTKHYDKTT